MTTATSTARLLNPGTYDAGEFDPATQRLLRATIQFFEAKGKRRLIDEMHTEDWYGDFVDFLARKRAFATLLPPARDAPGARKRRGDRVRTAPLNEILVFY